MNIEGDNEPTHGITVGEIWHEKGSPNHEVRVTETTPYQITYEYVSDGEQWTDSVGTFKEAYEY